MINKNRVKLEQMHQISSSAKVQYWKSVLKTGLKPNIICTQCEQNIKAIVHPKMKILSSFTHPYVNPNLEDFFSLYRPQEKILLQ